MPDRKDLHHQQGRESHRPINPLSGQAKSQTKPKPSKAKKFWSLIPRAIYGAAIIPFATLGWCWGTFLGSAEVSKRYTIGKSRKS